MPNGQQVQPIIIFSEKRSGEIATMQTPRPSPIPQTKEDQQKVDKTDGKKQ